MYPYLDLNKATSSFLEVFKVVYIVIVGSIVIVKKKIIYLQLLKTTIYCMCKQAIKLITYVWVKNILLMIQWFAMFNIIYLYSYDFMSIMYKWKYYKIVIE